MIGNARQEVPPSQSQDYLHAFAHLSSDQKRIHYERVIAIIASLIKQHVTLTGLQ